MTPADALSLVVMPTTRWLAARTGKPLDTPEAWAMLLAIGGQESKFLHRRQIGGPARGFWQFERGKSRPRAGLTGLLLHEGAGGMAVDCCVRLHSSWPHVEALHEELADNDLLACSLARLLLWTVPHGLPGRHEPDAGWAQYVWAWRPGKPRPETWRGHWDAAWAAVDGVGA